MNKYTDLIQSKKLAEVFPGFRSDYGYVYSAGRDGDKWSELQYVKELILPCSMEYGIIYAWNLSDILERLPAEIEGVYILTITKSLSDYMVRYRNSKKCLCNEMFTDASLLTALVDLTLWLHEQKYIGGQNG